MLAEDAPMEDPRFFAPEQFDQGLRFDEVSPYLAGVDLGAMASAPHRRAVKEFCDALDRDTSLQEVAELPTSWKGEPGALEAALKAFRRGVERKIRP
jgi:hypothetical protein